MDDKTYDHLCRSARAVVATALARGNGDHAVLWSQALLNLELAAEAAARREDSRWSSVTSAAIPAKAER